MIFLESWDSPAWSVGSGYLTTDLFYPGHRRHSGSTCRGGLPGVRPMRRRRRRRRKRRRRCGSCRCGRRTFGRLCAGKNLQLVVISKLFQPSISLEGNVQFATTDFELLVFSISSQPLLVTRANTGSQTSSSALNPGVPGSGLLQG